MQRPIKEKMNEAFNLGVEAAERVLNEGGKSLLVEIKALKGLI